MVVAILEALPRLGPPVPASVVADVASALGRRQTGVRPTPPAGSPRSLSLHRRRVPDRAISDSRPSTMGTRPQRWRGAPAGVASSLQHCLGRICFLEGLSYLIGGDIIGSPLSIFGQFVRQSNPW